MRRMAHVLPVLSDHHRHQAHRPAHPVREVITPPRLEVFAIDVIKVTIRTRLEQLHAHSVCPQDQYQLGRKGHRAEPVKRDII